MVLLAQASSTVNDLAPYITGGSAAAAVAAVVYIARKFAAGDLVARSTAERDEHLDNVLHVSLEREQTLRLLLEAQHKREEQLVAALQEAARALWEASRRAGPSS